MWTEKEMDALRVRAAEFSDALALASGTARLPRDVIAAMAEFHAVMSMPASELAEQARARRANELTAAHARIDTLQRLLGEQQEFVARLNLPGWPVEVVPEGVPQTAVPESANKSSDSDPDSLRERAKALLSSRAFSGRVPEPYHLVLDTMVAFAEKIQQAERACNQTQIRATLQWKRRAENAYDAIEGLMLWCEESLPSPPEDESPYDPMAWALSVRDIRTLRIMAKRLVDLTQVFGVKPHLDERAQRRREQQHKPQQAVHSTSAGKPIHEFK